MIDINELSTEELKECTLEYCRRKDSFVEEIQDYLMAKQREAEINGWRLCYNEDFLFPHKLFAEIDED